MTIAQLKKELAKYSDDTIVLVQGYEGGFSEVSTIKQTKVELNYHSEDWNGPHEETEFADTSAIIFMRKILD